MTSGLELIAKASGATILPDNGIRQRPSSLPIPYDRGLALVSNTDGGNVARPSLRPAQSFYRNADLRCPDFLRIVFDPSRLRKKLFEFTLRYRLDRTFMIEQYCSRTGGALIQRQYVWQRDSSISLQFRCELLSA